MINYLFEVTISGNPAKLTLHGPVNRIAIRRETLGFVRDRLREANEHGTMLVHLESDQDYNAEAIDAFLRSMSFEDGKRFLDANRVAPETFRRTRIGSRGSKAWKAIG